MTDDSTTPIGQVHFPVSFGQRDNYHTELVDFDVAHIRLPYNAILGYPALAKFMAVTHHGYNILKMPGSGGIITVPCKERDAVCSLERASKLQQSATPAARASALLRPPPRRRRHHLAQGLRRQEPPVARRQDPCPF